MIVKVSHLRLILAALALLVSASAQSASSSPSASASASPSADVPYRPASGVACRPCYGTSSGPCQQENGVCSPYLYGTTCAPGSVDCDCPVCTSGAGPCRHIDTNACSDYMYGTQCPPHYWVCGCPGKQLSASSTRSESQTPSTSSSPSSSPSTSATPSNTPTISTTASTSSSNVPTPSVSASPDPLACSCTHPAPCRDPFTGACEAYEPAGNWCRSAFTDCTGGSSPAPSPTPTATPNPGTCSCSGSTPCKDPNTGACESYEPAGNWCRSAFIDCSGVSSPAPSASPSVAPSPLPPGTCYSCATGTSGDCQGPGGVCWPKSATGICPHGTTTCTVFSTVSSPVSSLCSSCVGGEGECRSQQTGHCTPFYGSTATCQAGYELCSLASLSVSAADPLVVTTANGVYYMGLYHPYWVTVNSGATCTQTHVTANPDFCSSISTAFSVGCLDLEVQVLPCAAGTRRLRNVMMNNNNAAAAAAAPAATNSRALVTDDGITRTDIEVRVSTSAVESLAEDEHLALLVRRGDQTLTNDCQGTFFTEATYTVVGEGCPVGPEYTYFVAVVTQETLTMILSGMSAPPSESSTPTPTPAASTEPTPAASVSPSSSPLATSVAAAEGDAATGKAPSSSSGSSPDWVVIGACAGAAVVALVAGVVVMRSKSKKNAAKKNAKKSDQTVDRDGFRTNSIVPEPTPVIPIVPDHSAAAEYPKRRNSRSGSPILDGGTGTASLDASNSSAAVFAQMMAEVEGGSNDVRGPNPV